MDIAGNDGDNETPQHDDKAEPISAMLITASELSSSPAFGRMVREREQALVLEQVERETTRTLTMQPREAPGAQVSADWLALTEHLQALTADREAIRLALEQTQAELRAESAKQLALLERAERAELRAEALASKAGMLERLCDLLPRALQRLRSGRSAALLLELGRQLSEPEVAVRLSHLLLSLGRGDDAVLVLESLGREDWSGCTGALERLARDAVSQQQTAVVDLLRSRLPELPEGLRIALEAHTEFDRGTLGASLRHVQGVEDAAARLVQIRTLLANNRFEEARALMQEDAPPPDSLEALRQRGNAAVAALSAGDYRSAAAQLEEVTRSFEAAGLEVQTAVGYNNLAAAWELLGRYADAWHALRKGADALGDKSVQHVRIRLRTLVSQGYLDTTLGLMDRARRTLAQAENEARQAKNGALEAEAILQQCRAALHSGEIAQAEGDLARARVLVAEFGTADTRARFATFETEIAILAGRSAAPLGCSDPEVRKETARELYLAEAWRRLQAGEAQNARTLALEVATDADNCGHAEMRWAARCIAAAAGFTLGNNEEAERESKAATELLGALGQGLPSAWKGAFSGHPRHAQFVGLMQDRRPQHPAALAPILAHVDAEPAAPSRGTGRFVGRDPALMRTLALAERFADADAPVLILGESGTGKELLAELLHAWSPRRAAPLVRVNAAALSDTLLLSELFGHERGAFTGADRQRAGKFEAASGGSLFLDEIGDISGAAQTALLRVLQEGEFHRVGGNTAVRVNTRVIAATHQDLPARVQTGAFRLDLYYRISSLRLTLPPLRERPGDLPLLIDAFIGALAPNSPPRLWPDALELLCRHSWPGNVRELRNVLERLVRVVGPDGITASLVWEHGPAGQGALQGANTTPRVPSPHAGAGVPRGGNLTEMRKGLERETIRRALEAHGGNISHAAESLGMNRSTLSRKAKAYGFTG